MFTEIKTHKNKNKNIINNIMLEFAFLMITIGIVIQFHYDQKLQYNNFILMFAYLTFIVL